MELSIFQVEGNVIERIGFKKQMSNLELRGLDATINEAFECYENAVETFGMAYTSSSEYATYSVCNGEFCYGDEDYEINHFAVLVDGRPVMVCNDADWNEFFFIIEG